MLTANMAHFILFDIIVFAVFVTAVYNGLKNGGLRAVRDFAVSAARIAVSCFGAYAMTNAFNPFAEGPLYDFLLQIAKDAKDPENLPFVGRLLGLVLYFTAFMIILSLLERALVKKYRNREKDKKREVSTGDRTFGALLGVLLFVITTALPCPLFISSQALGLITNGNDVVYKTLFAVPVNLAARPFTRLVWGEETEKELWVEKGILIFEEDYEKWCEEHSFNQQ